VNVHVEGRLVFNGTRPILHAALAGFGLGYVPEEMARPYIARGELRQVLQDWCPAFPGYHLYYPSQRQLSRAMTVLVDALRYPPRED
jgi:DNA-binding transcriptional LysR family regulator